MKGERAWGLLGKGKRKWWGRGIQGEIRYPPVVHCGGPNGPLSNAEPDSHYGLTDLESGARFR